MARRLPMLGLLAVVSVLGTVVVTWSSVGPRDPTVVLRHALATSDEAPPDAPNVLVIIGCTVRQDQVGAYGGSEEVTPFLDRLADEGVLVADPIAAGPWTRVASAAIVTGEHAVALGMVEPGPLRSDRRLPESAVTLSERLHAAGWRTLGFTANPNLNAVFGFDQGFEAYKQLPSLWRDDDIKLPTSRVAGALVDLVAEDTSRPVYLQAMLIDAHAPFVASPSEGEAWRSDDEPPLLGQYRAALNRFDRSVERLWRGLEGAGWSRENTLVLVLSDHGEGLAWPAHHGKSHGRFLSPSAVHGVWIAWGAGVARGHRVDGVASQVDVVPTTLGLLGLEGADGPGRDLSEALAGRQATTGRDVAFTDTWFLDASRAAIYSDDVACQLAFEEGRPAGLFSDGCFDREQDPRHDRVIEHEGLTKRLRAWRRDSAPELGGARPGPARGQGTPDGLAAQLEALGYTAGPEPQQDGTGEEP